MRLATTILAICVAAGPALAVPSTCTRDADRTAFDTAALKSELMVTALVCKQQDSYNAFIHTYQPAVVGEEKDLAAYFKRAYGRQYQKAYDDYISNLANVQSDEGLKMGTAFCETYTTMFDEVLSLHSATELADYAHSKALVQPVSFQTCAEMPAKPGRSHGKSKKKRTA
ncbi:MAG: hypothetical protein WDN04_14480 [Rhodospirillales bacterium]